MGEHRLRTEDITKHVYALMCGCGEWRSRAVNRNRTASTRGVHEQWEQHVQQSDAQRAYVAALEAEHEAAKAFQTAVVQQADRELRERNGARVVFHEPFVRHRDAIAAVEAAKRAREGQ